MISWWLLTRIIHEALTHCQEGGALAPPNEATRLRSSFFLVNGLQLQAVHEAGKIDYSPAVTAGPRPRPPGLAGKIHE